MSATRDPMTGAAGATMTRYRPGELARRVAAVLRATLAALARILGAVPAAPRRRRDAILTRSHRSPGQAPPAVRAARSSPPAAAVRRHSASGPPHDRGAVAVRRVTADPTRDVERVFGSVRSNGCSTRSNACSIDALDPFPNTRSTLEIRPAQNHHLAPPRPTR